MGPQKDPTTLHEYLYRRHHDLTREMEAIKNTLVPKDRELAEIRKAAAKLEELAALPSPLFSAATPVPQTTSDEGAGTGRTIKQLIIEALFAHFHDGATGVELRDHFLTVHGRDIDRTSISPQLTRLREEGIVEQMTGPDEGKWKLVPLRGVSADELIAIGHWPPGAEHAPRTGETEQPSGVKRRKVE
jgi:DNA-binding transcriptional ArsR family regulator